jgi:F-type H+-transporting ATPase subunit delta
VARVITAVPLTKEEAEKLQNRLEARFHRKMDMVCTVDPALIGGIRVETEGRVLDGSLKARLQEIKEVMNT